MNDEAVPNSLIYNNEIALPPLAGSQRQYKDNLSFFRFCRVWGPASPIV